MSSSAVFLVAVVLGVASTWVWLRVAARLGLLDAPNPLVPQHRHPTANMGGIAVAAAGYASVALHSAWTGSPVSTAAFRTVFLPGLFFLLLGMADDLLRLSARAKFAGQIVIAVVAVAAGLRYPFTGQVGVDAAIATLLILTAVNAVNLTDVCDGLVAGLAAVALAAMALAHPDFAGWSLAAAGACVGFLVFNAPPARVFLGDAGSHWLGFMLIAGTLTMAPAEPPWMHAVRTLLLCGVFFFELALLIIARASRGFPFWHGSPDHFSLRLQAAGLSRWATVLSAWSVGAGLGVLAVLLPGLGPTMLLVVTLSLLVATIAGLGMLLRTAPPLLQQAPPSSEPRRLLWIHQNFVSARQAGNARAVYLVSAMLERGWVVDVVTTQAAYLDPHTAEDPSPLVIEKERGLTIHRLRHRGGPNNRALSWLSFCLKAMIFVGRFRRVDVVFASTPPLPQILIAALAALVRRAPLVLEVRDLWPLFLQRLGVLRSAPAVMAMQWMEAFAYRSARHSISVSPAFASYLGDMGVPRERVTVAPTGIDSPASSATPPADRSQWRQHHGLANHFIVVYAGSFNESYALSRLLQSAERSVERDPRICWVFAGGGRGQPAVEEAARRLPNLRYLGGVSNDELRVILRATDLGIVSLGDDPVLQIVIPGKLFAYCAAELPVICTVGGMPGAIVRAAGAGKVLSQPTPEQLAEAVNAMARLDVEARRACGRQGRLWMEARMPCARSARDMARVVESVQREWGGRSQAGVILGAVVGAVADVATGRSRRAAARLLTPDLGQRCEESLRDWLDGQDGPETRAAEAALSIPTLLTARAAAISE